MLERTSLNKEHEIQNNMYKALDDPIEKTTSKEEMINTSIHSN